MIAQGQIGALLNVIDTPLINEYQRIAVEKSRLHIPLLFGLDVIHGFRTEFPIPVGNGFHMGPCFSREGISCGSFGSVRYRHSMDLFPDG